MNAWNAHNAMNVNKVCGLKVAAVLFAASFLPSNLYAQASAPGMFDVKEVVIQYARFANPKASDVCGLTREGVNTLLIKTLADGLVPAISVADAKPPMMGVARIEIVPEISTISNQGLDCTSWVSLTAQSQNNVRIPPIDAMRNVTVVYWRKGTLTMTDQSLHSGTVADLLQKMATDFAQRYLLDQPPKIPQL